jgi:hypothetical protein
MEAIKLCLLPNKPQLKGKAIPLQALTGPGGFQEVEVTGF